MEKGPPAPLRPGAVPRQDAFSLPARRFGLSLLPRKPQRSLQVKRPSLPAERYLGEGFGAHTAPSAALRGWARGEPAPTGRQRAGTGASRTPGRAPPSPALLSHGPPIPFPCPFPRTHPRAAAAPHPIVRPAAGAAPPAARRPRGGPVAGGEERGLLGGVSAASSSCSSCTRIAGGEEPAAALEARHGLGAAQGPQQAAHAAPAAAPQVPSHAPLSHAHTGAPGHAPIRHALGRTRPGRPRPSGATPRWVAPPLRAPGHAHWVHGGWALRA